MRGTLIVLAGLIGALVVGTGWSSGAAPDPVNCTGYPEPRIYLENQSWWDPQQKNWNDPNHPGTGEVGHIHMGMCFPLYQRLSGDTVHLDVTVKLHDIPGTPGRIVAGFYGDVPGPDLPSVPRCQTGDCTYTVPLDVRLTQLQYSGWREFMIFLPITNYNADGSFNTKQYNVTRWSVYVDRPQPPSPTAGACPACVEDAGGDSWYRSGGSAYARVNIKRSSIPWDEATGNLKPVSGVWRPTVEYTTPGEFAYIDPAFHAVPPSKGTIVVEASSGPETKQFAIDTTTLANGLHRLVIGSSLHSAASSVGPEGTNTGVLVIPFLVNNPTGCGQ